MIFSKVFKNTLFLDILFPLCLIILSVFLISNYVNAHYLYVEYWDWLIQAFRIRFIETYGLSSWTHVWSNGMNIWATYQFIPHILTLSLVKIAHITIPRAMVIITIFLFIFLRLLIYFLLRRLTYSPFTAFICAVISFDIAQYWLGVGDYSLMWGITLFPISIFLLYKYYTKKWRLLFPYLCGLFFYIHPLLGISSIGLWSIAVIASDKKILSGETLMEIVVFLIASSLFWFPTLFPSASYFPNDTFKSKEFFQLFLKNMDFLGLGAVLLFIFAASVIQIFLKPMHKGWIKALYIFVFVYLLIVLIGINADLPEFLMQTQMSRGVSFIGIAIVFLAAGFIEYVIKSKSTILKGILVLCLLLSFVEAIWTTSTYSPVPSKGFEDIISKFITLHKDIDLQSGRVWTPRLDLASYYAPMDLRYTYSYFQHKEPNQISVRMFQVINDQPYTTIMPAATLNRVESYLKLTGSKYILLEEESPFTKVLMVQNDKYKDLGAVNLQDNNYHAFSAKWEIRNAILLKTEYKNAIDTFPFDIKSSDINNQIELDNYVQKITKAVYKDDSINLPILYPTQESILIKIPANRSSNIVFLNESYDSGWAASFNGKIQKILPAGPNFMKILLHDQRSGGVLSLQHSWPNSYIVGIILIGLIPVFIITINLYKAMFLKRKEENA